MPNKSVALATTLLFLLVHSAVAGTTPASAGDRGSSLVLDTNWGDDTVSLVDIASGRELAVIHVGTKPYDVQVSPNGRFAYVSNSGSGDISVIDIQAMLEAYRIPVGEGPRDIDISADGKFAVSANSGDDSLSFIDLDAKKELYRVRVGTIPYGVALADGDKVAVVTNWGENTLSVVDLRERKERKPRLTTGSLPYTVVVPSRGQFGFITNFGSHTVSPVNISTMTIGEGVPVGRSPWGIGMSADGRTAVVADFYSGEASFMSVRPKATAANGVTAMTSAADESWEIVETARIKLNEVPPIVAFSSDAIKESVALSSKIATDSSSKPSTSSPAGAGISNPAASMVRVQRRAKNAAMSADGRLAVISDLGNNELMVVDIATKKMIRTIKVGKAPYGIAFLTAPVAKQ
jgi:YVTN family beta-propeller protein